jgi:hypothetical protein
MHVGYGRSVAPRRDEEVTPGEVPPGDSLHPGGEDPAAGADAKGASRGSGGPLDLL